MLVLEFWEKFLKEVENFLSVSLIGEILGELEEGLDHGKTWIVRDL